MSTMVEPSHAEVSIAPHRSSSRGGAGTILRRILYVVPTLVVTALILRTARHRELNERYFVGSAFYIIAAMLTIYACVELGGGLKLHQVLRWLKENRWGLAVTIAITTIAVFGIDPAYRVLADEANLIGVSKNLYYQHTANFATTGKFYFENFWQINIATDRRPALYPFLVSLVHVLRGYSASNGFYTNAAIFSLFVLVAYRLAKTWGNELFGITTAFLVAANPNTLVAARSAGFDLLASFMLLVVIKGFVDYSLSQTPRRLAILALQLCMLAHIRYEGWALVIITSAVLLMSRMLRRESFSGYGFVYSVIPVLLLPRYWQSVAKAHDAEQPLSATLFSFRHFVENGADYLGVIARPFEWGGPHSPWLMALGLAGCAVFALRAAGRVINRSAEALLFRRQLLLVVALVSAETVISFSYFWGKSLHPSACRLFIWADTLLAFFAAWLLVTWSNCWQKATSWHGKTAVALGCSLLFAVHVPAAQEARFTNSLILTRQAAILWRYFEQLHTNNILIMTDRPGLFTIMNYGALDISQGNSDRSPLLELTRHLYQDVYLVQEVDLNTRQPLPGFDVWPDTPKETLLEFQNTDTISVRVARVRHP